MRKMEVLYLASQNISEARELIARENQIEENKLPCYVSFVKKRNFEKLSEEN